MKNYSDWERFGDNIQKTVQSAIDSKDFRSLNRTITNTINRAMDSLMGSPGPDPYEWNEPLAKDFEPESGGGSRNGGAGGSGRYGQSAGGPFYGKDSHAQGRTGRAYNHTDGSTGSAYGHTGSFGAGGGRDADSAGGRTRTEQNGFVPQLYTKTAMKKVLGWTLALTGYCGGAAMVLGFLITGAAGFFVGGNAGLSIAVFTTGIMAVPFIVMGVFGSRLLSRLRRFGEYLRIIGREQFYNIKELAKRLETKESKVIKDLKWMIRKGWFLEGHLDDQNTCLIVSQSGYREYRRLMSQREELRQAEAAEQAVRAQKEQQENQKKAAMDPQVQEIMKTGNAFITKIRECNDAIPGEEVSEKIYRMELLTRNIFERVEAQACDVSDIRRLMEYYLPTAVKLLEAYEELDKQEIQGENILSSKREIEETLDTLNTAFEKLLDSLFQDTAWDVSSDISVLKTMLAQEGLTGSDFKGGK